MTDHTALLTERGWELQNTGNTQLRNIIPVLSQQHMTTPVPDAVVLERWVPRDTRCRSTYLYRIGPTRWVTWSGQLSRESVELLEHGIVPYIVAQMLEKGGRDD